MQEVTFEQIPTLNKTISCMLVDNLGNRVGPRPMEAALRLINSYMNDHGTITPVELIEIEIELHQIVGDDKDKIWAAAAGEDIGDLQYSHYDEHGRSFTITLTQRVQDLLHALFDCI